jgi:flagellar M-ring protein FliF
MNMTSFMQRVQRVRALEGELARTIVGLNGVKNARVHLVLPEREGFSREVPKPTAAVTVTMDGPERLTPSQAAAIRLLVAGAVPRMQQDDVSVLDPSGVVLAANGGTSFAMGRLDEMRNTEEQELQRTVSGLLEPLLGRGKVRVAAAVDLETARQTDREEKFDPLSQVERSKQSQNDRDSSDENRPQQPVTVGQNLPNQQVGAGSGNRNSTSSSHNSETVNYELSSTTSERVREPGDLKRLTVAVVVDGTLNDKGVYTPRGKEELDRLAELVRSAVGFNEKRGDKVTVETMQFAPLDALGTSSDGDMQAAAPLPLKVIIPAAVLMTALVLGMAMLLMRRRKAEAVVLPPEHEETQPVAMLQDPVENLFSIAAVGGTHRSPLLIALNSIVDDRPDETLAVLRSWIVQGTA